MVHLVRRPTGSLPREVFQARPAGRGPQGMRTRGRDYISTLAREHLGFPPSELVKQRLLLPPRPDPG